MSLRHKDAQYNAKMTQPSNVPISPRSPRNIAIQTDNHQEKTKETNNSVVLKNKKISHECGIQTDYLDAARGVDSALFRQFPSHDVDSIWRTRVIQLNSKISALEKQTVSKTIYDISSCYTQTDEEFFNWRINHNIIKRYLERIKDLETEIETMKTTSLSSAEKYLGIEENHSKSCKLIRNKEISDLKLETEKLKEEILKLRSNLSTTQENYDLLSKKHKNLLSSRANTDDSVIGEFENETHSTSSKLIPESNAVYSEKFENFDPENSALSSAGSKSSAQDESSLSDLDQIDLEIMRMKKHTFESIQASSLILLENSGEFLSEQEKNLNFVEDDLEFEKELEIMRLFCEDSLQASRYFLDGDYNENECIFDDYRDDNEEFEKIKSSTYNSVRETEILLENMGIVDPDF